MLKVRRACLPVLALSLLFFPSCSPESNKEEEPSIFVVYGDSRTGHDIHRRVVQAIIAAGPLAVFHTGDFVKTGINPFEWDTVKDILEELRGKTEFFAAIGNHERNSPFFFSTFALPNNERWYSVDRKNIHFIVLNSNTGISPGSPQYNWLEEDLQNTGANVRFTVVLFHHPLFTTGKHRADEKEWRPVVLPLFEQYGVDMVFNGHNHCYERSLVNGIHHIVTGGGGAPLYDQQRTSVTSQIYLKEHHFCRLTLTGNRLQVDVLDINSNLLDRFVAYQ